MSLDWMLQLYSAWSSFLLEVVCTLKFIIIIIVIIIVVVVVVVVGRVAQSV